jgi:hypothetical protein
MTHSERTLLRGLLLTLVEVQNLVRAEADLAEACGEIDGIEQIRLIVESPQAAELIQRARALLDIPPPTQLAIPAALASVHT